MTQPVPKHPTDDDAQAAVEGRKPPPGADGSPGPPAGPHATEPNIEPEATPGSGTVPDADDDIDAPTG